MIFGLKDRDVEYIKKAVKQFPEIEKVVVFGSRAMGNYKQGSDIDLAIFGEGICRKTIIKLNDLLNEEYPIAYFFDIIYYGNIDNKNLKDHIDEYGIEFYFK